MELNDLKRFNEGQRTIGKIEKLKKQLEVFDKCDPVVKIYGYTENHKRVDYDMPHKDHGFYEQAQSFLRLFRFYLMEEIKQQEDYFKSL